MSSLAERSGEISTACNIVVLRLRGFLHSVRYTHYRLRKGEMTRYNVMSSVVETSQPYKTKKRHIKSIVFYLSFKSFIFQMYYLSFSPQLGQVLFSALILPPQLGQKLAVFLTLIGVTSSSSSSSSSAYPIK